MFIARLSSGQPATKGWVRRTYACRLAAAAGAGGALWFEVPESWAGWISPGLEAPVAGLFFLAMRTGEPLTVEEPLSSRFGHGLRQVMRYFHMWYPDRLAQVDLAAPGFAEQTSGGVHTACCFSGGVDSFHSLLRHRPGSEPDPAHRAGHALFVHGLDIPLAETDCYDRLADRYQAALAPLGVELVRCRTNLRELLDPHLSWMTVHGAALQAVAHFLGAGLRRLIIPSTNRYSLMNPPIGSNPVTDPQLSSERLDLLHDGCDVSRIGKIVALADHPVVQAHLRVCFQPPGPNTNCGRCVKCQKTMLPLWGIGILDRFSCFPPGFDPARVDAACFDPFDPDRYTRELSYAEELRMLYRRHRPGAERLLPAAPQRPWYRRWFAGS